MRSSEGRGTVLTHPAMNAASAFEKPDEVRPQPLHVTISGDSATVTLPRQSVAALQLRLA